MYARRVVLPSGAGGSERPSQTCADKAPIKELEREWMELRTADATFLYLNHDNASRSPTVAKADDGAVHGAFCRLSIDLQSAFRR